MGRWRSMRGRGVIALVVACAVAMCALGSCASTAGGGSGSSSASSASAKSGDFSYWNADSASLAELTSFVEAATDEGGDGYIPPEDRIVTFDMDGTLLSETVPASFIDTSFMHYVHDDSDPSRFSDEVRQVADGAWAKLEEGDSDASYEMTMDVWAQAYAGMTVDELRSYTDSRTQLDAEGFSGMTYKESFYKPMLQVIEYLQANDFTVYVVTGTERTMAQELTKGVLNVPTTNVMGSDVQIVATGQGDASGDGYQLASDDQIVLGGAAIKQLKQLNKVTTIVNEIGKQPVLAFGNTAGDQSMLDYAITNNAYPAKAFFVLNDDTERDYGNADEAATKTQLASDHGWVAISMADDFATIYGEGVTKTPIQSSDASEASLADAA